MVRTPPVCVCALFNNWTPSYTESEGDALAAMCWALSRMRQMTLGDDEYVKNVWRALMSPNFIS